MGSSDDLTAKEPASTGRDFLEAAMAASALAAFADGTVSPSERHRIGAIIVGHSKIRAEDSEVAIEVFDAYLRALEKDVDTAEKMLAGKLRRIADHKADAELIAGIVLAISHADGEFVYAEKMQFQTICELLGVDATNIKPL